MKKKQNTNPSNRIIIPKEKIDFFVSLIENPPEPKGILKEAIEEFKKEQKLIH